LATCWLSDSFLALVVYCHKMFLRCLFTTEAEHKIQIITQYSSKNENKTIVYRIVSSPRQHFASYDVTGCSKLLPAETMLNDSYNKKLSYGLETGRQQCIAL